ncbi:MAG: SMP-30/gluconolactonase/LRE family protein [Planctomycetales bacterium]|nr:SMP-30/gluconolactonase/LRE family protein [Planctomycetales bacterium]
MTSTTIAEVLYAPKSDGLRFLPEGPTALGIGRFSWVAIQHGPLSQAGSLNIFDLATGNNLNYPLPGRPGFAKPTSREGVFIVGCERELGLFDTKDNSWTVLAGGVDSDVAGTIINDGTLYGDNVVFGTKDLEFKTPKAGLYLYRGRDQRLIKLQGQQTCSNGKDVVDAGDGGLHLIDIDSPTRRVVRYRLDLEQGTLGGCETIVDLAELPAVPDGMTLTPDEQSMIISFYNPNPAAFGETRQYSMINGQLEHVWQTPYSPQATCPMIIETAEGTVKLVITTAVEHMPEQRRPESKNAGMLFIAETPFATAPASPAFRLPRE